MSNPVNEARRPKFPKARYRVRNWGEYDQALQQRGSLTVWFTPEAIAAWHPAPTGKQGRARSYSDLAIETGHLLRLVSPSGMVETPRLQAKQSYRSPEGTKCQPPSGG